MRKGCGAEHAVAFIVGPFGMQGVEILGFDGFGGFFILAGFVENGRVSVLEGEFLICTGRYGA